jgi:hypothetical protein
MGHDGEKLAVMVGKILHILSMDLKELYCHFVLVLCAKNEISIVTGKLGDHCIHHRYENPINDLTFGT